MDPENPRSLRESFYEIAEKQKRKTILMFLILMLIYFACMAILYFAVALVFFPLFIGNNPFDQKHLLIILIISSGVAWFQWYNARRQGAEFILERLNARLPDPYDLYHKRFVGIIEEVRIACGCKRHIKSYIIPANAVNCLSLVDVEDDGVIGVTEGALARFTREELQAAVAHEMSHIMMGDALFVTFACSLGNIFEKIGSSLESDETNYAEVILLRSTPYLTAKGGQYAGDMLSRSLHLLVKSFSFLISREREYLADAAAVEITRNPSALAQAIYKAHTNYSYLGSAGESYSPIFMISPESRGGLKKDGFWDNLFSTHPPTMERVKKLNFMVHKTIIGMARDMEAQEDDRKKAMMEIKSFEEMMISRNEDVKMISEDENETSRSLWDIRGKGGEWSGPYDLAALFAIPWFTAMSTVRPADGTEEAGRARAFPEILDVFTNPEKRWFAKGTCPGCGVSLTSAHYEGVLIKKCDKCGGRLVPESGVMRIISRRELKPSDYLLKKARKWKYTNIANPLTLKRRRIEEGKENPDKKSKYNCPLCGYGMVRRSFSYQYYIPIDDCRACRQLWFGGDELEILQILIEESGY